MHGELEKARQKLEKEYQEVRESLGSVHVAFDAVLAAGPEDDLHDLLLTLEKAVKDVRDGGLIGSGANAHRRALRRYEEMTRNPGR